MPLRVQTNRSSTKNLRPTTGSREPGELFVNFADLQLGVSNASKVSTDLIAVRYFSTATNYSTGDFVINSGQLYRANQAVVSGVFTGSQWNKIPLVTEAEAPIAAGTTAQYWRGDKSWQTLDKTAVGLSQVDNTSDLNKPISTAEQTALNLKANLASPTFTGTVIAPTPAPGTNNTTVATTAFVAGAYAPLQNPVFGGDPQAPTPAKADNDTSIATTAYVKTNLADYAPLVSPALTGNPTSTTPTAGDADTSIATTAFVQTAIGNRPTDAPSDANSYGRKAGAWVDVAEEAPADGVSYGRKNGAWVASVGGAVVSDTAPGAPLIQGQLWYEADSGNTFLWYDDGSSSQWVQVNVQPAAAVSPTAGLTAETRNRIVNSAMQVSQEQGDTTSGALASGSFWPADQWQCGWSLSPGTAVAQRIVGPSPNGSQKVLYHQVGTALATMGGGNYFFIQHAIEGTRMADFQWGTASAKQAVLRFWCWVQVAGTYSIQIQNSAADRSFIAAFTIAAGEASTWVQKILVIPGDTTGTWLKDTGVGCYFRFVWASAVANQGVAGWQAGNKIGAPGQTNGAATASTSFQIADVGLYMDPLNTGTPPAWTMPDEAQELAACMRYWQQTSLWWSGYSASGTTIYGSGSLSVKMRSTPALTGVNAAAGGYPATTGALALQTGPNMVFTETRVANATLAGGYFGSTINANARM